MGLRYPFDGTGFTEWAWSNGYDPDWITNESTTRGKRYHAYIENRHYGINEWADEILDDKDSKFHTSVNKFFNDGWEVIESEIQVFNDDWHYAGRFDMLVKNERLGIKKALGDCKTYGAWRNEKYKPKPDKLKKLSMQLTMYRECLKENIPMIGIMLDPYGYTIEDIKEDKSVWEWLRENRNEYIKLLQEKND